MLLLRMPYFELLVFLSRLLISLLTQHKIDKVVFGPILLYWLTLNSTEGPNILQRHHSRDAIMRRAQYLVLADFYTQNLLFKQSYVSSRFIDWFISIISIISRDLFISRGVDLKRCSLFCAVWHHQYVCRNSLTHLWFNLDVEREISQVHMLVFVRKAFA